jgi:hypothetical protein
VPLVGTDARDAQPLEELREPGWIGPFVHGPRV